MAGLIYSAAGQFHDLTGRIVLACVCSAFTALGGYLILWLLQSKTVLYADQIDFQGVFSTKTFHRDELIGWRVRPTSPPTLVLERKGGGSFKTGLVFRVDEELSDWFDSIPSLDEKESALSEASVRAEIQNDERFGATLSERTEALQKARKIAKTLSTISIVAVVWAFIYPRPYEILMLLLALLPWTGIEIMRRSHGLFRADELKNDAHPTVAYALIFPGIILCLRATLDYNVLQSTYAVALYVLVGCALFGAVLFFDSTQRRRRAILPVFFLFGVAYGYGVVVEANALFDRSPGILYTATVKRKEITSGRSNTYKLDLSPWGPNAVNNELDVSSSTYNQIQTGQTVQLKLKEGTLGVHWYYLYDW
ncbi:MAG TPA: hypothetical protein VFE38_11910 [Edaphobacter sp.]|nr:hypothetical protein [Edaphobacter sp.]